MKTAARVTSKGQITLPVKVRRDMGIKTGDKVEFQKDGAEYRIRPARSEDPFAEFQGIGTPGIGRGRKAVLRYFRRLRGR